MIHSLTKYIELKNGHFSQFRIANLHKKFFPPFLRQDSFFISIVFLINNTSDFK